MWCCKILSKYKSSNFVVLFKKTSLDEDDLFIAKTIIDSKNKLSGVGLPIGNQTSQWFGLFYLNPVDRLIKVPGTMPKPDLKDVNVIWLVYSNRNFNPCCGKVIFVSEKDFNKLNIKDNDKNDLSM